MHIYIYSLTLDSLQIQGTLRQGPPGTGIVRICRLQWKAHRIAAAWGTGQHRVLSDTDGGWFPKKWE